MENNGVRALLVFVPFYDNVPHRMKLRFRAGMPSDELMGQIQRQLEAESAAEVRYPLNSSQYVALLFDPRDNALVPFERSSYELQLSCSKVLLHPRQAGDAPSAVPSEIPPHLRVKDEPVPVSVLGQLPSTAVASSKSLERERMERSTATMLHIVGQVVAELSLQTKSNCELTERTWPTMLAWALDKEHTTPESVDPTIVDQFKKTLLTALSTGEKIRGPSSVK